MSTATATRLSTRTLGGLAVLAAVGSVLSSISLIGPTWLLSPAQPVAGAPEMSLDFPTLGDITASSPSTVQSVFAVESPLSWTGFYDAIPDMRIGGYLISVGLLLIVAYAAASRCWTR